MPLAEGVSVRIAYKFYSAGTMTSNALEDTATAPGASGGQTLRRVSSTLSLAKATYQSAEVRTDYQIVDFRHGMAHVEGNVAGELSPGTYMDLFEAVHRDTRAAAVALDQTGLTSITASVSGSSFTVAAGDPVALGLKVGGIIRLTGTGGANDNTNFVITAFGGSNNRTITVTPAPKVDIGTPDTAFTLTQTGKSTIVPASGFVRRKAAFEVYHSDLNVARLYTECRLGSYRIALPATGMCTCEFGVMGRSLFEPGSGPYFTSPTAPTSTPVLASVQGALLRNGVKAAVITAADMTMNLTPSTADVVGQNFPAEVFLGRANLTGTLTSFLDGPTLIDDFVNESELSLLIYLSGSSAANAPAMTLLLPRVKLGSAAVNLTGESGQSVSYNFQALKYTGSTAGMPATTMQIMDTDAT
jgi:Phage tail tube protein